MADKQTNLHPKNNITVNLRPNIIGENIPDNAVTLNKLSQDIRDKISVIPMNTTQIEKNTTQIEKLNEGSKILQPYNLVVRMQGYEDYTYDRNEGFRNGKNLLKGKDAQPLEPIRIYQGNTYLLQHIWGYFTYVLYDDGSSFVITDDPIGDFTTTVKADKNGYICATIRYHQPYEFLIGEVESVFFKSSEEQVVRPHTYIVDKNGNGNFSKLSDAIEEATKYLDSLVYVGDGVWDLISELGDDVEKINVNNRGLYLKNRIHLIFSSNSKVTWNYKGSTSDVIRWGTIFNSGINGFTIENATLEGSNLRYLIHDERDSSEDTYINRYINCKFKMDNSHSTMTTTQCIGGGLGLHGYIVIDNCHFESVADDSNALFWHNSADTSSKGAKSHIILKDSYVAGSNGVGFHYYGNSTKVTEVDVSNCFFGRKIDYGPETIDGTSPHINLVVNDYCNKIRSDIVITANSDIISSYDYKVELIDGFYFIHFEATLIDGLSVISNGVNIFKLNKVISHTHAVLLSNDYHIGYAYAIGRDVTVVANMTVNSSKKLICEYFCTMN